MVSEPFSVTELEVNGPGGIIYCTTPTTNGTSTVTIAGDGTGKPILNLIQEPLHTFLGGNILEILERYLRSKKEE